MFKLIGGIFKYTFIVLAVLVLSHIIEVKGVTISQHVLNGMHLVSGYNPKLQADRITADYSKIMQNHVKELDKISDGNDVTTADQKALNQVIENSQFKH